MTQERRPPQPTILASLIGGLLRLPDIKGAVEGLVFFLVVLLAGYGLVEVGALHYNPIQDRQQISSISLSAWFLPAIPEELAFRGWLRKRDYFPAAMSLLLFVAWHPLQVLVHSPFGEAVFLDWRYLAFVFWLGLCCTISRMRSGSIWPSVVIHWGVVVLWKALFDGG